MLRNPVDRAFSHYQMCVDPVGTPQQLLVRGEAAYKSLTFEEVIEQEIKELDGLGINVSSFIFKECVRIVIQNSSMALTWS